jgi:hypothetical protein
MNAAMFHSLWPARLLGVGLVLVAANCLAAPVRVTTWNLQTTPDAMTKGVASKAEESRIPEAAAALKKLNPEVIILQNVRDWQMCGQLAQALKPADYSVLVCSSFRDARTGASSKQQVAILSKQKAYFSWSEVWQAEGQAAVPGGYAFAAVRIGKQRVGFFSVQVGEGEPGAATLGGQEASIRQLLGQVDSVKQWVNNGVEVFVVAGAVSMSQDSLQTGQDKLFSQLETAGFGEAFVEPALEKKIASGAKAGQPGTMVDCLFAKPAGAAVNAQVMPGTVLDHHAVTCELEFDPAKQVAAYASHFEPPPAKSQPIQIKSNVAKAQPVVVPASQLVQAAPVPQAVAVAKPAPVVQAAQATSGAVRPGWLAGLAAGTLALVVVVWILARRRPRFSAGAPTLIAMSAESGGGVSSADAGRIVITPRSVTGSAGDNVGSSPSVRPRIHIETPGGTQSQSEEWRRRALEAEQRAERTTAIVRKGLIPHLSQWLKNKLVRKLISDRAELLETQQAATLKALAVDERLARIESQIQQQNSAYERRIEELTRELISAKEENRELIRAKIAQVKAEMEAARARTMQQAKGQRQQ